MSIEGNVWSRGASAWRELIDTATISWDFGTNTQAKANLVDGSITTAKLATGSVDNTILADMAQSTIKGRAAGAGTGDPTDLTAAQATAILNAVVGDSGSGGTKGLVPAPSSGDAAAGKYLKADGTWAALPSNTSAMFLLASGSTSNQATLDIVLTSYTSYRSIIIYLTEIVPQTDDTQLFMRFSTDGGANYDAGASNYIYTTQALNQSEATVTDGSTGATQIGISTNDASNKLSNDAGAHAEFWIQLLGRTNGSLKTFAQWQGGYISTGPGQLTINGSGHRTAAQDTDAVRFLMSSGNITANYAVYGTM